MQEGAIDFTTPSETGLRDLNTAAAGFIAEVTGVNLDLAGQKDHRRFCEIISGRIFDRGMTSVLPPLEPLPMSNAESYDNRPLSAVPVLSSGMAHFLTDAGYTATTLVDVSNLFGASQVSHLNGDRLLRSVCTSVGNFTPGCRLVRWGGDEIIIFQKPADKKLDIDTIQRGLNAKKSFYKTAEQTTLTKITANIKTETVPVLIERRIREREAYRANSLHQRLLTINTLHPEFQNSIAAFLSAFESDQQEKLIFLIETNLFDPVIQGYISTEFPDYPVRVYKDVADFLEHLKVYGKTFDLVRIDLPGALKRINDEIGLGYAAGDDFIRHIFKAIASTFVDQDLGRLDCFRRGSEFLLAFPKDADKKRLSAFETALTTALNENYQTMPLMPVVTDQPLDLNDPAGFGRAMHALDTKMWQETIESIRKTLSEGALLPQETTKYLAYYFNPYDKRGSLRLRKLIGDNERLVNALKTCYRNHPVKLGAFELNPVETQRFLENLKTCISS